MMLNLEKKRVALTFGMLLFFSVLYSQHQELNEDPLLWGKNKKATDSSQFHNSFLAGTMHGHFRSFFSSQFNQNSTVEYALAMGGGIQFRTRPIYHLSAGISGFFVFNAFSTNLTQPHPLSKTFNRYEIGLFDVTDPSNKNDLDRLEDLFVEYKNKKITVTVGRQPLNTPFINLQDGRMRPTEVQGIWSQYKSKTMKLYIGWLNQFSPRSTFRWYNTGGSIGLYSVGVNSDGTPSGYKNQLNSKGVALLGSDIRIGKKYQLQFWNQLTDNIFNSNLLQLEKIPDSVSSIYFGLQLITQQSVNQGGHIDASKRYFQPDQSSLVWGGRLGIWMGQWDHSINFTRITKHGRYLMPREWGRDPFYTFLMGERNEGLGDVHALVIKSKYNSANNKMIGNAGIGYFKLPDVNNYALNKYAFPSYLQFNADIRYNFSGFWKGWQVQVIYFYKKAIENTYEDPKYYINKVNMGHFNFIMNFHF